MSSIFRRATDSGAGHNTGLRPRMDTDDDISSERASVVESTVEGVPTGGSGSLSISDFDVLSKIGEGGFGTVLLVRKKNTGKLYALKVLMKRNMKRSGDARRAISESAAMQEIKHPFVVTLHFAFQDTNHIYFVLEFVGGGDLYSHLERQTFPEEWAQVYIAEIALAIQHVHDHDFVYRDLKPENILVAHDGHLKLADFGLAKKLSGHKAESSGASDADELGRDRLNTMIGTMAFSAPEMFLQKTYGKSVDWWALGLLLCEMITGDLPLVVMGEDNVAARVESFKSGKHLKPLPRSLSRQAADLIRRFLTVNPKRRMCCGQDGFNELKRHPFFEGLDWDKLLRREVDAPLKPLLGPGGVIGEEGGGGAKAGTNRIAEREADLLSEEFGLYVADTDDDATGRYAASAALCEAAAHSDLGSLRTLMDAGTDVNAGDYDKRTALHLAASEGLGEVVKFLIADAKADPSPVDRWGNTPLDDAIRSRYPEVVELLISLGAHKGAPRAHGAPRQSGSLSITVGAEVIEAAASGDVSALRTLLESGVDLMQGDYDKRTAIHLAASEGFEDVVHFLLDEAKVPHSPMDRWGHTPLDDAVRGEHGAVEALLRARGATTGKSQALAVADTLADVIDAASKGDVDTIRRLVLEKAVDVNQGDYDRRTALHLAASEGLLPVVEYLVDEAHAGVNPVDRWGGTPLDDAVRSKHKDVATYLTAKGGYTAQKLLTEAESKDQSLNLIDAASQGNLVAVRVLIAQGADVNQGDYDKRTALHLAASEGMLEMVRVLVREAKAEVNPVDRWGGTPFDDATRHKHDPVIAFLSKNGGKKGTRQDATIADLVDAASKGDKELMREFVRQGVQVNAGDYDKRTPLHLAASEGRVEMIRLLVEEGKADLNPVDRWGGTPLDDAVRSRHTDVVAYLKAKGATRGDAKSWIERAIDLADGDEADAANTAGAAGTPAPAAAGGGVGTLTAPLRPAVEAGLLCAAAAQGRVDVLRELNAAAGWPAAAANVDGRTALHCAAAAGRLEAVKFLVDAARAPLDATDCWGCCPLDEAVRGRHADVAKFLRQRGAKHSPGGSEAGLAATNAAALHAAAFAGDVDRVKELLKTHGDGLARAANHDLRTALHLAAAEGHAAVAAALVDEAKADASAPDRFGFTPLDDAVRHGRDEVASLLRARGGMPGAGAKAPCTCAVS